MVTQPHDKAVEHADVHENRSPCLVSLVAVVVTSALVLMATPAKATEAVEHHQAALSQEAAQALGSAVDEPSRTFDGAVARAAGASADEVTSFAAGWLAYGGIVEHAVPSAEEVAAFRAMDLRACAGRNSWDITGAQVNVYINNWVTNDVVKGLAVGAAASGLVAAILAVTGAGAAIAGAVAAFLTLGAALITACNHSRGVGMHSNPLVVVWCTRQ